MRMILFFATLISLIACTSPKNTASRSSAENLDGNWVPTQQEMGGNALPASSFANQKLQISDSNFIFIAESIDKGIVRYAQGKMDIFGKEGINAGKHFPAIYKFENSELSICYNLKGTTYPESFSTVGKPGLFMAVYRRRMIK